MFRISKQGLIMAMILLVGGCSLFGGDEVDPSLLPKPLPEIKKTVEIDELWDNSIGDGSDGRYVDLQVAQAGDNIYAIDTHGLIKAIKASDGDVIWKKNLEAPIAAGLGASYDSILVATSNGVVIDLDAATGKKRWQSQVSSEVLAAPQTDEDVVVVLSHDQNLQGLDLTDGKQRWQQSASQPVLTLRADATPLVKNSTAFVGYANGRIRAVNLTQGVILWDQRVSIPQGSSELSRMVDVTSQPVLDGGILYVVSYQGNLAAFEERTGRVLWTRHSSSYQGLALDYANAYVSDSSGFVTAFNKNTGQKVWQLKKLENRDISAPVQWGSYLVVGDYQGYIHVISPVDGHLVGRYQVDSSGIRTAPVVIDDNLYVYGNSGTLAALKIEEKGS